MTPAAVTVENLEVTLADSGDPIVSDVSFQISSGEILAVVGESGSGKTTAATALLGFARTGARIARGRISIADVTVLPRPRSGLSRIRGGVVAYVPQDPSASLNPSMRIGIQVRETLRAHERGLSRAEESARIAQVLGEVRLPTEEAFLARYPHQLSGGQQQRICMAMAVVCRPRLVILDEPTTGLDVTTQAHVLDTLTDLVGRHDMAALYVTHDLAVVGQIAHRVLVLYGGRIAEMAATKDLFSHPLHPYTRRLIEAVPDVAQRRRLEVMPGQAPSPGDRGHGCSFAPRCPLAEPLCQEVDPETRMFDGDRVARCHRAQDVTPPTRRILSEGDSGGAQASPILTVRDLVVRYGQTEAVKGVSFELRRGECLALVGESGSGKTTLSRGIVGLGQVVRGAVVYDGEPLPRRNAQFGERARREIQYIFQSSHNALNPRRSIAASLNIPIRQYFHERGRAATTRALAALERVSLPARALERYPQELSGGERQRAAIARALIGEPRVLLCDEITSALDVSVQAVIVQLLERLRVEEGLSLLFVTHNTALVRSIAGRVVVLLNGSVVETGPTAAVLDSSEHAYTRELVANTPRLGQATPKSSVPRLMGAVSPHGQ